MRLPRLLTLLLLWGCATFTPVRWYSLSDPVTRAELSTRLATPQVIFIGEFHDRRTHHELQMKVIELLVERGERVALGLEMFSLESQTILDHWVAGRIPADDFMKVYRQNWTIDWEEYAPMLRYARNHQIPLLGLNAPLDIVMKVSRSGWRSLSEGDRARLPVGVTPEATTSYQDFIYESFATHGMTPDRFPFFVEAQGVRNSTMARSIEEGLRRYPDRKLVVITGMGHAVRGGIPQMLPKTLRLRTLVLFPYDERMSGRVDPDDADLFIIE